MSNIFGFIKKSFPGDIKHAFIAFVLSCSFMAVSLFLLSNILQNSEDRSFENKSFRECGLEPYIIAEDVSLPTIAEEGHNASNESRADLLARAIDMAVPNEIYAARVAFGAVLLNREKNAAFPSSLSSVIKSAQLYPKSFEKELPERTRHAARDALLGVDPTMGALYVIQKNDPHFDEYKDRITAIYGEFAFIK